MPINFRRRQDKKSPPSTTTLTPTLDLNRDSGVGAKPGGIPGGGKSEDDNVGATLDLTPADTPADPLPSTRRIDPPAAPATKASGVALDAVAPPTRRFQFVVGWLVVIAGPGCGHVAPLYVGTNPIGRGEGALISLEFGDDGIRGQDHAIINYDHHRRQFHLIGRSAPVELNGAPLLEPCWLKGGEFITLGRTRLRFVALCDTQFDWQDSGVAVI
ncbi:MAG: FHA domain-containing protein [Candidatus Competibacterales bacterium]